jgi:hypothetical protein
MQFKLYGEKAIFTLPDVDILSFIDNEHPLFDIQLNCIVN